MAFIGNILNCFGGNSLSDIPTTPRVEQGPREEGERTERRLAVQGGCGNFDVAIDHVAAE